MSLVAGDQVTVTFGSGADDYVSGILKTYTRDFRIVVLVCTYSNGKKYENTFVNPRLITREIVE